MGLVVHLAAEITHCIDVLLSAYYYSVPTTHYCSGSPHGRDHTADRVARAVQVRDVEVALHSQHVLYASGSR